MMLTGTLIEDLIATVERVERNAGAETGTMTEMDAWFVSGQDSASCDHKLLGVA